MKRRRLIRGVASASMVTMVGASAAGAATTARQGDDAPYLAVRRDDGSHRVVERGTAGVEPDCVPECYSWLCCQCDCDCCSCTQFCPV